MRYPFFALCAVFVCFAAAKAEDKRRGLVTSTQCPYTCSDARIPAEDCRERQRGGVCEVEDLRQAPGHRTLYRTRGAAAGAAARAAERRSPNARGLVTSAACPYSCRDARIPADSCREWQAGDRCFVEDLRQAPGHRTLMRVPA